MSTIRISLVQAPEFILGLVKKGLVFEATQDGDELLITLTGGY